MHAARAYKQRRPSVDDKLPFVNSGNTSDSNANLRVSAVRNRNSRLAHVQVDDSPRVQFGHSSAEDSPERGSVSSAKTPTGSANACVALDRS